MGKVDFFILMIVIDFDGWFVIGVNCRCLLEIV